MADPLEEALSDAFSTANTPENRLDQELRTKDKLVNPATDTTPAAPTVPPVSTADTNVSGADDSWKAEYEANLGRWREESAEAREKAERNRQHWEQVRASGKDTGEFVDHDDERAAPEPEAASSRLASSWATFASTQNAPMASIEQPTSNDASNDMKWENVASETNSSFPSLTFPEPAPNPAPQPAQPVSMTMAVFDSSLSTRTRVTALCSALAINFLLPFVNGVMLGFGEIFAKNIIGERWLGWKIGPILSRSPGSAAASAGIGKQTSSSSRRPTGW